MIGLPRYRPSYAFGRVEITRLRDPITGVFYRADPDTGSILPPPEYVYYFHPPPTTLPNEDAPDEEKEIYEKAMAYINYFKMPLPKITVPEGMTLTISNDETIVYKTYDSTAILPNADNPYTSTVNIECTTWGPSGNLSEYYTKGAYFNGAISKIVTDTQNPYQKLITRVTQDGDGVQEAITGQTVVPLTLSRGEFQSGELIICNCWKYFDRSKPKPNNKYEYHTVPYNICDVGEYLEAYTSQSVMTPAQMLEKYLRAYLIENDSHYKDHPDEAEYVEVCWEAPDNFTTYNIDFRNLVLEDEATWFVPDPHDEASSLFLYFRPTYDRSGSKIQNSLDYLIFRPLMNFKMMSGEEIMSILVMYAGFGGISSDFYLPTAASTCRGYVGNNHLAARNGRKFLPAKGDPNFSQLYCKPVLTIKNGFKLNVGYALQIDDISGGRDYESDDQYRERIKSTKYYVTATNPSIERYVRSVKGVVAANSYDAIIDDSDPQSIGFMVKVRTSDNIPISINDDENTPTGQLVNELIRMIKPAGVQYGFDTSNGYGIALHLVVVGHSYPDSVIIQNIIRVVENFFKSLNACKPFEYGYLVDIITNCAEGVSKIDRLEVFRHNPILIGEDALIEIQGVMVKPITAMDTVNTFGERYYVPKGSYTYFDVDHSTISVIAESVIYHGCRRSDNCN
jgi:hypothetical protein